MARAQQPTHLHKFASRVDFQYITAFAFGCITPLAGGVVANFASVILWNAWSNEALYTTASPMLINSAILAVICLVYLACFALLVFGFRRFGVRPNGRGILAAMITAASLAILSTVISLNSFDYGPEVSVYLDFVSLALLGLGYVLGWWVIKRYAKLGK